MTSKFLYFMLIPVHFLVFLFKIDIRKSEARVLSYELAQKFINFATRVDDSRLWSIQLMYPQFQCSKFQYINFCNNKNMMEKVQSSPQQTLSPKMRVVNVISGQLSNDVLDKKMKFPKFSYFSQSHFHIGISHIFPVQNLHSFNICLPGYAEF